MVESRPAVKHRWMSGYDAYYAKEIAPILDDLEASRQAARRNAIGRALLVIVITLSAAFFVVDSADEPFFGLFVLIAGYSISHKFIRKPLKQIRATVKAQLIGPLCAFFDLQYTPDPIGFDYLRFRRLSLLPRQDELEIEDRIWGTHNGVAMELTEVHLENVDSSEDGSSKETVFRGPAMIFGFPKQFSGQTIVKPDRTAIGNFFTEFGAVGDRVRLEDSEFERCFEVYSTDQIEARYLLTPTFMTQLLSLRASMGRNISVAFDRNQMLLTANNGQDWFEADGWAASYYLPVQSRRFVKEISILFEIVEALQLDDRQHLKQDDT